MMRVLSEIYPPEIKPVRDGWYLTRHPQSLYPEPHAIRWWNGGMWHSVSGDVFPFQDVWWRGLAFDPAGAFDHDSWNWKEPGNIESGGYEQGVFVPGETTE